MNVLRFARNVGGGRRCLSSGSKAQVLTYNNRGNPPDVIQLIEQDLPKIADHQALLRTIAAPINPVDINMIQGVYPIKPQLPAVGGNESVSEVLEIGAGVKNVKPGDWVVLANTGQGAWRSHAVQDANKLWKVSSKLKPEAAATIVVNPTSAYRMLKDFAEIHPGDVVIQNGANSTVGVYVIQIAKLLGAKSINVVRNRPDIENLREHLMKLGSDLVLTEEQLKGAEGRAALKQMPPPKLALNCVGGRSTLYVATVLGQHGCLVTYGGMSKQPLQIPTGPLIFADISLRGFWMSKWYTFAENQTERESMFDILTEWFQSGQLITPAFATIPLKDYKQALEIAVQGSGSKQMFEF